MPKIEETIVIQRSAEVIFEAISNVEMSPRWISALVGVKDLSGDVPAVGSTFVELGSFMGKKLETHKVVTVYDRPSTFAHRSTLGPVPQELVMSCDPVEEGTMLTMVFEAEPGGFFGKLPLQVLIVAMRVLITGDLKKLKNLIETDSWPAQ